MLRPPDPQAPVAARLRGIASSPVREILALTERPGVISFAGGLPAPELFDAAGLREAFAAVLDDRSAGRSLQYSTTEGDPELRRRVADRLSLRGLPTDPDGLLITSGSQQALTLIATVLLEPGDRILVEDPCYLAALQCFQLAGAVPVPVPCDDDGLDPEALDRLVEEHRPKLLYTVPTFHNPTGRTLPEDRRAALAEVIARRGLWTIEDDPYGELRYAGEPAVALAARDGAADYVLALSTLSKVAAPGLRIGWVRAPAALRLPLTIAKQAADLHSSTVDQAATARWLAHVDLDAHLERLRSVYRERRDAMLAELPTVLPAGSTFNRPDGGMFLWVRLPEGHDATALLPAALQQQVAYVPGAPFYATEADPRTLRLSFTTHSPAEIRQGLERLRVALAG
ncbi:Aspartate aminotransferase (AspB-4) [Patulibacter medicamentivorans]|uniref:Aspartate aminotransferase (AspB-4) n=1 Tax=Patulibacter medicamentivorans TaxID=1097667 RepID=H0E388_9ACTN|nr:PLP-dependent aminotransferase family protein [Patulibacter medicamentivorans]EHN11861.1 Aspartate aminotransferase (AspB-4) [Patulibacter medicamentivorans]